MNYKLPLVITMIAGGILITPLLHPAKEIRKELPKAAPKAFCVYMTYNGAGAENDFSNYTQSQTKPGFCGGNDILCFFEVCSDGDGTITEAEFNAAFAALDSNADGFLSDEPEVNGVLEKFSPSIAK